jgi:hypothetical protein
MTFGHTSKLLIGIGTLWVLLYPLLFMVVWFLMFFGVQSSPSDPGFGLFFAIFPLHCLTILLGFALDAVYLYHIIKNTAASDVIRVILAVGVFTLPFVAMPIYYYLFIWREQPPAWALAQQPPQQMP